MANWDHLSNIGLHPGLDPDPEVRLPVIIEAAEREIAKQTKIRDEAKAALAKYRAERRRAVAAERVLYT